MHARYFFSLGLKRSQRVLPTLALMAGGGQPKRLRISSLRVFFSQTPDAHKLSQVEASNSQVRLDDVWKGSESMFEFNRQSRNFQHSRLLVSILGMMSTAKIFEFKSVSCQSDSERHKTKFEFTSTTNPHIIGRARFADRRVGHCISWLPGTTAF